MRRQTRPFTVEVKQKRNYQKRGHSIWGDVDLSAAIADTTRELKDMDLPNRRLIDSNVIALDAEHAHKPRAEYLMANPLDAESVETATEHAPKGRTPETKKKTPPSRKAKTEPGRKNGANTASPAKEATATAAAVRSARKVYSGEERAQKLAQVETSISGGTTLKSAVKQAGISEQTYYHWKRAAAPRSDGDDLKDLVALEKENKRLKSLLAERLRTENAELKRKLGLQ
ncbi:transposase [Mesorhizobium sanjuanii]|uniref:Transposase n=1 Tax=Mesorhizobium sanjuanii TaxID=2037900 RepID=A0A2A6F9S9_9HYPH|nr:transposase [Mesorhizobium sanjuanii]PDQ18697.1 transposase [Mesorhizobium sanjuanii]